ncbi:hypothetical protein SUGI_0190470 [Cryptomeria japonica]|nr:hypothetical protein SUGI_0190470 [Cryptomeria japonica]
MGLEKKGLVLLLMFVLLVGNGVSGYEYRGGFWPEEENQIEHPPFHYEISRHGEQRGNHLQPLNRPGIDQISGRKLLMGLQK